MAAAARRRASGHSTGSGAERADASFSPAFSHAKTYPSKRKLVHTSTAEDTSPRADRKRNWSFADGAATFASLLLLLRPPVFLEIVSFESPGGGRRRRRELIWENFLPRQRGVTFFRFLGKNSEKGEILPLFFYSFKLNLFNEGRQIFGKIARGVLVEQMEG